MCCDQHAFSKVWNLVVFPWDTSSFLDPMLLIVICVQMPIMHVGFSFFCPPKIGLRICGPLGVNQTAICVHTSVL